MRDEGCERAVLWTVGDREATMAFYAAGGWRPDGRRATERGAELVALAKALT